jgi:hypothetical protein
MRMLARRRSRAPNETKTSPACDARLASVIGSSRLWSSTYPGTLWSYIRAEIYSKISTATRVGDLTGARRAGHDHTSSPHLALLVEPSVSGLVDLDLGPGWEWPRPAVRHADGVGPAFRSEAARSTTLSRVPMPFAGTQCTGPARARPWQQVRPPLAPLLTRENPNQRAYTLGS